MTISTRLDVNVVRPRGAVRASTIAALATPMVAAAPVAAALALLALVPGCTSAAGDRAADGPSLLAEPPNGLLDEPVRLRASGLPAEARVTLHVRATDASGRDWATSTVIRADERGRFDGDVAALTSSLEPRSPDVRPSTASLDPADGKLVLRYELRGGSGPPASATATRALLGVGVVRRPLDLADHGFVGAYWNRPGTKRGPAVLVLGGSGGGVPDNGAGSLLAGHGYPTLELAYFRAPGLPAELRNIPLEYFEAALAWLADQPEVDAERILLLGWSRGAELALLLGSRFPELVHGVIAIAPSSVVNPAPSPVADPSRGGTAAAWTHGGVPVAHVQLDELGWPEPPRAAEAVIPVERIRGRVLLVAGVADQLWPAAGYARAISDRLRAHGRRDFGSLVFSEAGHGLVETIPHLPRATAWPSQRGGEVDFGGSPEADARARTIAWAGILRELRLAAG